MSRSMWAAVALFGALVCTNQLWFSGYSAGYERGQQEAWDKARAAFANHAYDTDSQPVAVN